MKKLLLILFLFTGYTTFAQGKIGGEGNVIPTGNYPIVASKDIKGGLHKFQTIAERNALPANFKDSGMLGYVVDSLKYYKWNGADWEEFKTGSDTPTDYFTSYTQASDSSYLQTNRKDGTKQYVVIQADGLVGAGEGSGSTGVQSVTGNIVDNTDPLNPVVNGINPSQLSDTANSITLQRAFDNSLANGDYPTINGHGNDFFIDSTLVRINSYDEEGASSGIILDGWRAIVGTGSEDGGTSVTTTSEDVGISASSGNDQQVLHVTKDELHFYGTKDGTPQTTITMSDLPILNEPTTYIIGITNAGDTLKKVAYPTISGGITQSQLDDSTSAIRNDKQDKIVLTTTSVGAASLTDDTLNIPHNGLNDVLNVSNFSTGTVFLSDFTNTGSYSPTGIILAKASDSINAQFNLFGLQYAKGSKGSKSILPGYFSDTTETLRFPTNGKNTTDTITIATRVNGAFADSSGNINIGIRGLLDMCNNATQTLTHPGLNNGGRWISMDTNALKIDRTTGVITSKKITDPDTLRRSSLVIYEVSDGGVIHSASAYITVDPTPVAGTASMGEVTTFTVGNTYQATVSGNNMAGKWQSSNTSRATVDQTGLVTAISAGSVIITYAVTTACGTSSANIPLFISNP